MTASTFYNNLCVPLFEEADRLTAWASVAVTGKRCVAITGNRQAGGEFTVGPPANKGRIFGVAEHDAALNKRVGILRPYVGIVPVTTAGGSGPIAAFQEVMTDATGAVLPFDDLAASWAIGYAVSGSAGAGAEVLLVLYSPSRLSRT